MTSKDNYSKIKRYKVLTRDEEKELFYKYRNNDKRAFQKLVCHNMRFVLKIAHTQMRYCNKQTLSFDDMVQAGSLGLMKAIERFDTKKNFKLITYAYWWISAYIKAYIYNNQSDIRSNTTSVKRHLLSHRARILGIENMPMYEREDARKKLAKYLGVKVSDIEDMRDGILASNCVGWHWYKVGLKRGSSLSTKEATSIEEATAGNDSVEQNVINKEVIDLLNKAMSSLNPREQKIMQARSNDITMREIGKKFGVSEKRIQQIQKSSLSKMHKALVQMGIKDISAVLD